MARKKKPQIVKITVSPFIPVALIILELAGVAVSLLLTYIHIKGSGGGCDINETFSCSAVATSEYSEILGVPISWLGVLTYIVLLVLTIMGRKPEKGRVYSHAPLYIFVISIWCVIYSVVLFGISKFILHAFCTNCIALYCVNIGLLLGAWAWSSTVEEGRWSPLWEDFKDGIKNLWVWVAASSVVIVLVISFFVFRIPWGGGKTVLTGLDVKILPRMGSPNAPVQIVEFSDLKCPWCKKTHEVLQQARAGYGDKFVLYFAHFPLEQSCNEKLIRTVHLGACEGAFATRCAQNEGKFWEYTSVLFAHQEDQWDDTALTGYAKEVGMNPDQFRACLASPETKAYVSGNAEVGRKLKINHTPTIFFNSVEAPNFTAKGMPGFIEVLEQALSGTLKPPEPPKEK